MDGHYCDRSINSQSHSNFKYKMLHRKLNILPIRSYRLCGSFQRRFIFETASNLVISSMQNSVQAIQLLTGLPWWAAIAGSATALRVVTFPIQRKQILEHKKLINTAPEISRLNALFKNKLETSNLLVKQADGILRINFSALLSEASSQGLTSLRSYLKGVRACFKIHDISIASLVLPPFLQAGIFVSFAYSMKHMTEGELAQDLSEGGMLWFLDLTNSDAYYVLPFVAIGLTYSTLQLSSGSTNMPLLNFFRDFIQSILLLSFPLVSRFPCVIFCYWIPSSVCRLLQGKFLKSEFGRRFL